jgi:hypothetical protein
MPAAYEKRIQLTLKRPEGINAAFIIRRVQKNTEEIILPWIRNKANFFITRQSRGADIIS